MTANESWIFQGRQSHGWFGHGTSPHDDAEEEGKRADPLFRPENASRRVDYAAFGLVGHAPARERSRWESASDQTVRFDLQTAVGAWYAASGFRSATFRSRFFDPYTDDAVTDRLRSAARGIVDADSHAELGAASKDLATAALAVGVDRWPRFVGAAARQARTAVEHGEVPGAILAPSTALEPVYANAAVAGAATGATVMRMGGVLVTVLEAAPVVLPVVAFVVLSVWVVKNGKVSNVQVQGFGPTDHGVAPVSAEVNSVTRTVLLYRGPPSQPPDTQGQHTVELHLGEDGMLTDKDGRTVGRLGENNQVIPMQGVDIPGLFHGPAATPPEGRDPGKTLPPRRARRPPPRRTGRPSSSWRHGPSHPPCQARLPPRFRRNCQRSLAGRSPRHCRKSMRAAATQA